VLKRSAGAPVCEHIGMRVYTEDDLAAAKAYFERANLPARWVGVPHQGRTLQVCDPIGTPLEFCATMETRPRLVVAFQQHKGACPLRLDHFQILAPDVQLACEFYSGLGFRLSEYISPDGSDELLFVFLQRKGNPHDIVFANAPGPRLHHAAFSVPDAQHILFACDIAGSFGFGANLEFGPGRHGPGHALFAYFRDPDGHRIELFNTHYQMMDIENEPVRWDTSSLRRRPWGLPARRSWHEEASRFANVEPREPKIKGHPVTLERFLAEDTT
jgi:catechol 2,3-dioxygenase